MDPFQVTLLSEIAARCVAQKRFDLAASLLRDAGAVGLLQEFLPLALESGQMHAAAIAAAELSRLNEPLFPGDDSRVQRLQETLDLASNHPAVALAAAAELLRIGQPPPSNAVMLRTLLHHACETARFDLAHRLLDQFAPALKTLDISRQLDQALDAGNIAAAHQALDAMQAQARLAQ